MRKSLMAGAAIMVFHSAFAAEISTQPAVRGVVITVSGAIVDGDQDMFRRAITDYPKALVVLSSPGGNLGAGLAIGTMIRMKQYTTGVMDHDLCASACALIWVAGAQRYAGVDSHIGFHAAANHDRSVTGSGNAIVGAYLTNLGFKYGAIEYMTESNPSAMTYLTLADGQRFGIDFTLIDPPKQAVVVPAPVYQPPMPTYQAAPVAGAVAIGPSYDCSKPGTQIMQLICADPVLSLIDLELVQPYYVLRHLVGPAGWKPLMVEAIDFQTATATACGVGSSGALPENRVTLKLCMATAYIRERDIWMSRLSGAGLEEAQRPIEYHIALQYKLQVMGFLPVAKADGIYGTGTRAAVAAWQMAVATNVTGLLGDDDAAKLVLSESASDRVIRLH